MTSYYVEQMLQALDKRSDVTIEEIATWEYQFFPLLEYGNRKFRIYELLAKDPGAYHSLIRKVFPSKNEEQAEPDQRWIADARTAYRCFDTSICCQARVRGHRSLNAY